MTRIQIAKSNVEGRDSKTRPDRPRSILTKTSLWNPWSKRSAGLYLSLSMLCLLSWWLFSMFWSSYVQSLKSWWNQLKIDFYSSLKMKSCLSLQFDNKCSNLTLPILTILGSRTFWLALLRELWFLHAPKRVNMWLSKRFKFNLEHLAERIFLV